MLRALLARLWPQPLVALWLGALAWVALSAACLTTDYAAIRPGDIMLASLLAVWVAGSYLFPIHLGRSHKVEMTSIALYLMAVLLPGTFIATLCAGTGVLAGEMLVKKRRGNYYSDVATAVTRWIVVVFAGSVFANAVSGEGMAFFTLVGTAVILWAGDAVTCPLVIAPMTGDLPLLVMRSNFLASAQVEGTEYLLGMLGAVAASAQIWALGLLVLPTVLVYRALKNVKEVRSNTRLMLESLADTVDLRDPYTGGHSQRVAEMTAGIVRVMGMTGPEAELIVSAARVHDIGKIGVPDFILNKPGRLTPEEEAIMQTHPDRGADLLKRYPDFSRGVEMIRHHHEAWDGTGYPQKLKAANIPFGARVIAVADSYDAMTSDRPYRKALSHEKATSILLEGRGKQWDAHIVDALLQALPQPQDDELAVPAQVAAGPLQVVSV